MSRRILAFIRHGDYQQLPATPSAHQPFGLTEQGASQCQQQAQALSEMLQQHNWQLAPELDCSTLLRAWQTAHIFQTHLQALSDLPLTVKSYENLAERSVGAVANLTVSQIEQLVVNDPRYDALPVNWKSDSHFCLPFQGAESLMQAGERVALHIQQQMLAIPQAETTQVKLMIGHGASFRHAAYQLGVLAFEQIAQLSMFHAQPILFEYLPDETWQRIAGEWKQRKPLDSID